MILVVAPDYRIAVLIASQRNLAQGQWRSVQSPRDAHGWSGDVHILIHRLWMERPQIRRVEPTPGTLAMNTVATRTHYPVTEALTALVAFGATTEYVST